MVEPLDALPFVSEHRGRRRALPKTDLAHAAQAAEADDGDDARKRKRRECDCKERVRVVLEPRGELFRGPEGSMSQFTGNVSAGE